MESSFLTLIVVYKSPQYPMLNGLCQNWALGLRGVVNRISMKTIASTRPQ